MELINKYAVLNEIDKLQESIKSTAIDSRINKEQAEAYRVFVKLIDFIENLEVINNFHEQETIQFDSIKAGIQAHAETYSFNIESKLFNQLTKEQQKLWREELEQACISGGEAGVELARDPRYKENQSEVKEELSIEEKAKRYDEAIERATEYETRNDCLVRPHVIFPELQESEHEKIRKELLNWFKSCHWDSIPIDNGKLKRDDVIAWFEKQKEQEPTIQPVWSEEDEKLYKLSVENLTELMHRFGEKYGKAGDCINWLNSIKDRFQKSK